MPRIKILILFLILVLGGGTLIGLTNMPGAWYDGLEKAWFNPPGWIFGPVWTGLYILIATAGAMTWERDRGGAAMMAWWAQIVLNFLWSPVFFSLQMPALALVVVIAMLAAILAFIALSWPRNRVAALLFVPYALWVAFATLLTASIVWLN